MNEMGLLLEIKEIFLHLTDQEPTPDEEIEARENLIEKFKMLKQSESFSIQINLIDTIINKLEKWDTLELWFKEMEELAEDINKFIKLNESKEKIIKKEPLPPIKKEAETKREVTMEAPDIDVSKIVFQVTEQFKGEINNLKNTIEELKKEIEKKELEINDLGQKKAVQKITPKAETKLTPPKIRIPPAKKPEKVPQTKIPNESKFEDLSKITKSIEHLIDSSDFKEDAFEKELEKEVEEEFEIEMKIPEIPLEKTPEMDIPEQITEEPRLTPIVQESSFSVIEEKIPFKEMQKLSPEAEKIDKDKLTPIPIAKPEIKKQIKEEKILEPIPSKKLEALPKIPKDTVRLKIPTLASDTEIDKPTEAKLKSIPSPTLKATSESDAKPFLTPIISKKPKISPISIEEIDTQSIKSSGTDLFNVLSSVRAKSSEQPLGSLEIKDKEMFEKSLESEGKERKPESFLLKPKSPSLITGLSEQSEDLADISAKDKDSLYQELIALEGRRYSLEKSYKDLSSSYGRGDLDEFEFNNKSQNLKSQLDEISARISIIRRNISNL